MTNSEISKIVHSTLVQMEARGEVREDDPASMGLKNTIVRNIAELELKKEDKEAVLEQSPDPVVKMEDTDHSEAA